MTADPTIERIYVEMQTNSLSAENKSDAQRVLGAAGREVIALIVERLRRKAGDGSEPTTADVLAEYERQQAAQREAELAAQKKKQQQTLLIVIGIAVALLAIGGILLYLKKRKE